MRMSYPLVSVLMPIYNEERFLEQALNSLLNQDYPNFEILVQNNASTDKTLEILNIFKAKYPNKIFIETNENTIPAFENWRTVLPRATGQYCVFVAGHDLWTSNFLSESVKLMQKDTNIVLAMPICQRIDIHNNRNEIVNSLWQGYPLNLSTRYMMMLHNYIHQIYGMMKTSVIQEIFSKLPHINKIDIPDHLVLLALCLKGQVIQSDNILFYMRKNEDYGDRQAYAKKVHGNDVDVNNLSRWVDVYFNMLYYFVEQLRPFFPADNSLETAFFENATYMYVIERYGLWTLSMAKKAGVHDSNPQVYEFIINSLQIPVVGNHQIKQIIQYRNLLLANSQQNKE